MVSFEIFVKSMPPSLSELKVIPSFCFAFKIPDDVTATKLYSVDRQSGHPIFSNHPNTRSLLTNDKPLGSPRKKIRASFCALTDGPQCIY